MTGTVYAPEVAQWSRQQLQQYLERRGFAVYDDESTQVLREAVLLDLEEACGGTVS